MNNDAINIAIKYLKDRGVKIPADVLGIVPLSILTSDDKKQIADSIKNKTILSRAYKQATSYEPIRQEMWAAVYDAVDGFLSSNGQVRTYKDVLVTAISKAYIETADIAFVDGGGSLPLDEDTASFARSLLDAQLGYVDSLFETLKQLRKEEDVDAIHEAFSRANGYANSLDAFYNSIKTMGAGNKMLTFTGDDGKESCSDCQKYKGQRHRASWWVSHDAVPPNRNFECGGYNCEHLLVDDNGQEFTI